MDGFEMVSESDYPAVRITTDPVNPRVIRTAPCSGCGVVCELDELGDGGFCDDCFAFDEYDDLDDDR